MKLAILIIREVGSRILMRFWKEGSWFCCYLLRVLQEFMGSLMCSCSFSHSSILSFYDYFFDFDFWNDDEKLEEVILISYGFSHVWSLTDFYSLSLEYLNYSLITYYLCHLLQKIWQFNLSRYHYRDHPYESFPEFVAWSLWFLIKGVYLSTFILSYSR